MDASAHAEAARFPHLAGFPGLRNPNFVAVLFVSLITLQALALLGLGTGRAGRGVSFLILVVHNLLALACAWIAFRRARGVAAAFWLLYAVSLLTLSIPTAFGAYDRVFERSTLSDSTWRVLFCLYGAPIVMMLFLPDADRERMKSEVFLDLFQVAIVVGLTFTSLFLLPVQRLLASDALLRNVSVSNVESFFLLAAVSLRLLITRGPGARNLLLRLGIFLLFCAAVTFVGNGIDVHHYTSASAWFDLGWAIPYVAGGFVALAWSPPTMALDVQVPTGFVSSLGTNLVLVAILFCIDLLMSRWKEAHGETLTAIFDLVLIYKAFL